MSAAPQPLGWGILGAGVIAHRFADAVDREAGHALHAVASRTPAKAHDFAERWPCRPARDYEDLLRDPAIDVVYVATTHNLHHAAAALALDHGKHVLVEKPFTVNESEAADLVARARARGVFAMEAMWTRFLPSWRAIRDCVTDGTIGDVRQIDVAFGGIVPPHYEKRLKDPALAGGATLDMGVYPIAFLCHVLGELPLHVDSMARFSDRGVDEVACYLFRFPGRCLTTVRTSFDLWMPGRALLHGTRGMIEFDSFPAGEVLRIHHHGGSGEVTDVEDVRCPSDENGFVYQVREVGRCIATGRTESDLVPLADTLGIQRVMDGMRERWGLRYPFE